jgi:hypothetical protein
MTEFTKYARQGIKESKALIGGYVDLAGGKEVRADVIGAACLAKQPGLLGPEVDIDLALELFPELQEEIQIPQRIYRKQAKRIEEALINDPVLVTDQLYAADEEGGQPSYLKGPLWRVVTALNDEAQVSRSWICSYLEQAGL